MNAPPPGILGLSQRASRSLVRNGFAPLRLQIAALFDLDTLATWDDITTWLWTFGLRYDHRLVTGRALDLVLSIMFPPNRPYSSSGPFIIEFLAALVVSRSIGTFAHFASAQHVRRGSPHWLRRVSALLYPSWLFALRSGYESDAFAIYIHDLHGLVHYGSHSLGTSSNYVWWSASGEYIGKANLLRSQGALGLASRIAEHYRFLLHPHLRDAGQHRYKLFRPAGPRHLFLMPSLVAPDPRSALASESLAIALTRPRANPRDCVSTTYGGRFGGNTGLVIKNVAKALPRIRRRPPRYLREAFRRRVDPTPAPLASIWSHGSVLAQLARTQVYRQYGMPTPLLVDGNFHALYRLQQYDNLIHRGTYGPLSIFAPERRMLWLSYLAIFRARLSFDRRISRQFWGTHIYWSVLHIFLLGSRGRRVTATRTLDYCIRCLGLIPRVIPAIRVPCQLLQELRAPLRAAALALCARIRPPCCAAWFRAHITIRISPTLRWSSCVNAQKAGRDFKPFIFFRDWSPELITAARVAPIMASVTAPWRLPRWPSRDLLDRTLALSWRDWSKSLGLRSRFPRAYASSARALLDRLPSAPPCPPKWCLEESHMQGCIDSFPGRIITRDDKDPAKLWFIAPASYFAILLAALDADPNWSFQNLTYGSAAAIIRFLTQAGIPSWSARAFTRTTQIAPYLFALVKSKCWSDSGFKTCTRAGHSCWRRVSAACVLPLCSSWRSITRAVQGMMQLSMVTFESWTMSSIGSDLDEAMSSLGPHYGYCVECARLGCETPVPPLAFCTLDADQAFESVMSEDAEKAFEVVLRRYVHCHGESWISIGKGRKADAVPGIRQFGCGRTNFRIVSLRASVWAGLRLQFSALGSIIAQQRGQSIGGIFAKCALSLVAGTLEFLWLSSPSQRGHCGFHHSASAFRALRYVDDILLISRQLCSAHLVSSINSVYQGRLAFTVVDYGPQVEWVDLALSISDAGGLCIALKSPNVPWIINSSNTPRSKGTIIPYPGAPPSPLQHLSSILDSRLVRGSALNCPIQVGITRALHDVTEFALLGYPYRLVRALAHKVPRHRPGALQLRSVVRSLRYLWPRRR